MDKPFKLLLIDDDEPVLANLCIFLRDKKYDVTSASDGLEGLKLFENDQKFSVLFLKIDVLLFELKLVYFLSVFYKIFEQFQL